MTTGRILKLLTCAALLSANSAFAQSAAGTFTVSATVVKACRVSAGNATLPDYDSTAGTTSEGTTTVDVTCTNGTPYSVTLASTGNLWQLHSGTNTLTYEIFSDSSHAAASAWNESAAVSGTGAGHGANHHTAYIRIPANQDAPEGTYSDTVTMTVTY
jgi:spore coat protein U-like protein